MGFDASVEIVVGASNAMRVRLMLLTVVVTAVYAGFVGRIDDEACEGQTAAEQCDSIVKSAVFPHECEDLVTLSEAIQSGHFVPSHQDRWEAFKDTHWLPAADRATITPEGGRCEIERVEASQLTPEKFKQDYLEQRPVIIRGATAHTLFSRMTEKRVMLYCFGDFDVTLSTANKNSYDKYEASLRHYVSKMIGPQTLNASGAATKYFFGDNRHNEWQALFQHYAAPSQYIWSHVSLSFGIGGSGSGVPFHTHGAVFADVMHGEKRWFLQAPGPEPRFDPDESSLRWMALVLPTYSNSERAQIMDCVVSQGEFMYIPSHWHHATLNIGETVFMSAFV